MKKGTRIASLLLVLIMVMVSMSILAFARVEGCPHCNEGGLYLSSTTIGEYTSTGIERACTSHTNGTDLKLSATMIKTYVCNVCGYGEDIVSTTYKWECHGYD